MLGSMLLAGSGAETGVMGVVWRLSLAKKVHSGI